MKVLVCGGRDYCKQEELFNHLTKIHNIKNITQVIHGGARGADFLAGEWAAFMNIECRVFRANWNKYRNAAGPIRNQQMLDEGRPDVVIAFPGGNGTKDMIERSRKSGVHVHIAFC